MNNGKLTYDIDFVWVAHKAIRIVCKNVGGFEDALQRTSLDVELIVAKTVVSVTRNQLVALLQRRH